MKNILDLLTKVDEYIDYLNNNGVVFNKYGFPILEKNMFIDKIPNLIVTYTNRNSSIVKDKKKTLICTYDSDKHIYPRLKKILNDIEEYKKYMGVIMSDLTVTKDMDEEWQMLIILINQLYAAILAVNGIKISFNTRIGNDNTISSYYSIPQNIICTSGFLGCDKSNEYDNEYISKILNLLPSYLLIYGKEDKSVTTKLKKLGINYRYYEDFHRLSKGGI